MVPGKDKIIECPHCEHKFRQKTIMSGNNIGAKIWTDGRQEAPMMPEAIVLSYCDNCKQYFWVEEAEVLEEIDPWEKTESKIEHLEYLTLEQYLEALEKIEMRSQNDTLFILRQIWWNYNDYYRNGNEAELSQELKNKISELQQQMLSEFDEEDDEQLMLKGELLRELGNFDEAAETLRKVTASEYLRAKEFILNLAEKEVAELRELEL